ncbi:MAG TPA: bifunctional phosphoribosylaminoimidazolecarboxamide formyltransferase/IMP cyclohydrolase [Vicinamibacterales bacterium]|nr:bifunctional phosphoribosylaminoimidazolecarboxamide formyltransferase/IMP cyclohydrolase [Vicinamibacterales bacterium]
MPRALLSVSDKRGIVELGRGLAARGFELVSTGGTAKTLASAGLPVTGVSDVTGFPEMLDGRVKTLHPKLHGGILARRSRADDLAALEKHGIGLVDLVVVNLYPFATAAANPATTFDQLIEEIDIGGPSMVRAAAKNFRDVLVVVDPGDYGRLLAELDATPSLEFRFELMRKALTHTASYDTGISATLGTIRMHGKEFARGEAELLPSRASLTLEKIRDLRYGENPHQRAAWYAGGTAPFVGSGFGRTEIIQGKELSYTNLLDLDAAARIVLEFDEPAAAVIKHTNPCGSAIGSSIADAYVRARDADPVSAFGGIVGLNRPIDAACAEAIASTKIDAVIAPAVDEAAKPILAKKAAMRVVVADFNGVARGVDMRSILGAMLLQERDVVIEAAKAWSAGALPDGFSIPTKRQPTPEEWTALRFAWRICAHVKSNTIIFTDARRTLAIGAGQMSRVDAANVAVMKARDAKVSLDGSVCASDAFFPFRDGLDVVAGAGAKAVIQPGGSVKDAEVIAAADEHGIAMVFAGRRHFRH